MTLPGGSQSESLQPDAWRAARLPGAANPRALLLVLTFAGAAVIVAAILFLWPRPSEPTRLDVRTVAGSGRAGLVDAAAGEAQFLQPAGLTVAPDGGVYVADAVGQRIRELRPRGDVVTVAGGGEVERSGLAVLGDYRNGSAANARFDRPTDVALGPDGALYVADELNHCVRRIASDTVTTYAGDPGRSGSLDGISRSARFTNPRALSFDGSGNLYVADFGVGIRKIAPDGRVTTLQTPGIAKTFTGVSAFGKDADVTVFAANMRGVGVYRESPRGLRFYDVTEGDGAFGFPYFIKALSREEAVFSDVHTHTVRYFRTPHEALVSQPLSRVIAGDAREIPAEAAGYQDGAPLEARFNSPSGIGLMPDGSLIVADAGNRRLRAVPSPNRRHPIYQLREFDATKQFYRIVYVTNSFAFWNSLWDDSVGGIIEHRLVSDRASAGLPRTPRVFVVRIDGASTDAFRQYAQEVLSSGVADLVIYDLNPAEVIDDIAKDKKLANYAAWTEYVAGELRRMQAALHESDARLVVAVHPSFNFASPLESMFTRETTEPQDWTYEQFLDFGFHLSHAAQRSGVPTVDLFPPIVAEERRAGHVPLYEGHGDHMSRYGNAFIADKISDALERLKPWSASP